ncbi:uridine kinase family protein [Pseudonocardia asaccharolytica]|uniref:Adenylate kinase n=1 Tax=Pseudonocardia asaccharolytica DSM 44247 = NBRC 16224 TaxID=1123024 RepID=A0A511DAT3_9PSEU|nr:hypothetical protein [Pseudonocardia asaccharolytica]GEL20774.1 adenylate kinase [Pseudonocardia asaccharolytica DSM 44247 = NBRC 16224]
MDDRRIAELAARVRASRPDDGRLVTIDGFSGAGKTELATRLGAELDAPVLTLEELYPGWDGLAAAVPLAVEWIAEPLAAGRPARWQVWDWERGARGAWRELAPAPLVVLEGCGAGARALRPFTAVAIWVDAPPAQRERRLRARADWTGYAPFRARWADQEASFQAREGTRERADIVVDNSD